MKTRTNILFYLFLLTFAFILCPLSFLLVSCNTTEPPPPVNGNDKPKPKITLTVDDTSPTEVWLNLITENISLPDTIKLIRNNDTVKTIELFDSNYVIYEESLQPSTTYTYQVSNNQQQITSNEVTAVTMDTTSHNFTWEVFEFGEHGNSILRDVAIIDENNIWAVGAIYLKDSTGANDSKAYNAVHWDGNEWKHKRIQFYTFCNQPNTSSYPARSILAFSQNQILISSGSQVTLFDGENQLNIECIPVSVNKMWGTDINNVYAVGAIGGIAHYNGTTWRKIESGTDVDLRDVWGDAEGNIWICGYSSDFSKTVLIYYNGSKSSIVYQGSPNNYVDNNFIGSQSALWVSEKGKTYVMNHRYLARIEKEPFRIDRKTDLSSDILLGMGMTEKNNAILVGQDGLIGIYNGKSYVENREFNGRGYDLYEVDILGKTSVAVGQKIFGVYNNSAIIIFSK